MFARLLFMGPGSFRVLVLRSALWPKLIGCLFLIFLKALEQEAVSFWNVPSAMYFSTCGFALCTWRQMRHGWLNGPVFSDSQSRSSSCIPCLLRTYGRSSHRTCASTCFHRPSCLGLTWAHLLPFPSKSWPLISDFKASNHIWETLEVFICTQVPTFQMALVGLEFIFCFCMICNLVTWVSLGSLLARGGGAEMPDSTNHWLFYY